MLAYALDNQSGTEPAELLNQYVKYQGLDKDLYDLGDMMLLVATDRLSAAGKSLAQEVPGKGIVVNHLSAFWFRKLHKVFPSHFISVDRCTLPEIIRTRTDHLEGRLMLVWKATPLPIRFVVRGYLAGAGWRDYQETGQVGGNILPVGMTESQRLPYPIICPELTGFAGADNTCANFATVQNIFGKQLSNQLQEAALKLYFAAWGLARERGVIIADTSFEFGLHNGKLMLIDDCLTPDNSRFWQLSRFRPGGVMPSMDKQLLVDYLETIEDSSELPILPQDMLEQLGAKYQQAHRCIVGKSCPIRKGEVI